MEAWLMIPLTDRECVNAGGACRTFTHAQNVDLDWDKSSEPVVSPLSLNCPFMLSFGKCAKKCGDKHVPWPLLTFCLPPASSSAPIHTRVTQLCSSYNYVLFLPYLSFAIQKYDCTNSYVSFNWVSGISVVKALAYWLEGHKFKFQHG